MEEDPRQKVLLIEGENDVHEIQVARWPKKNCKRCYGRGWTGRNVITDEYVRCLCTEGGR